MVGDVPSQRLKSPYFWEQVVNELHQKWLILREFGFDRIISWSDITYIVTELWTTRVPFL
jgi:hypothetical protein